MNGLKAHQQTEGNSADKCMVLQNNGKQMVTLLTNVCTSSQV